MKIAALALLSSSSSFQQWSSGRNDRQTFVGAPRPQDRRRKPRTCVATQTAPSARLATGLAIQVIAQLERSDSDRERVQTALSAYGHDTRASGITVNLKA